MKQTKLSMVKDSSETLLFPPISWRFKMHTTMLEALRGLIEKKKPTYFLNQSFKDALKAQTPSLSPFSSSF